jgi:UDP-N-acetylglucosamine 2-epimerase
MKIHAQILTVMLATALLGFVAAITLQHVSAPRRCNGCAEFKKLTHEFEKNVIKSIGDPNIGPAPHLRELLQAYSQDVRRIFIGDPGIDQVRTLLQSYEQDVTTIFEQNTPEPDKQLVKDFRGLTHDFEKAVIGLQSPPEPE